MPGNKKTITKPPPPTGGKGGGQLPPTRSRGADSTKPPKSDENKSSMSPNSREKSSTSSNLETVFGDQIRDPNPVIPSESETESTTSQTGLKRPLPSSSEKVNPPPAAKRSFADMVKGVKLIKLTIMKVKDPDNNESEFEDLTQSEFKSLYDSLFDIAFDAEVLIKRVVQIDGKCLVYCHNNTAVHFVKRQVPRLGKDLKAFEAHEGPNMAKFGALIPDKVTKRKTDSQITAAIRQQVPGKVTFLTARDARGKDRHGKYMEFGMDRCAMETLLSRNGLVGLGLVTVNLKIKSRPKDVNPEELRLDNLEVDDTAELSEEDTH